MTDPRRDVAERLADRIAGCCGWYDEEDVLNLEQHCGKCGLDIEAYFALREPSEVREPDACAMMEKHIRHVRQSPGVGAEAQRYAIAALQDVLDDLRGTPSDSPTGEPVERDPEQGMANCGGCDWMYSGAKPKREAMRHLNETGHAVGWQPWVIRAEPIGDDRASDSPEGERRAEIERHAYRNAYPEGWDEQPAAEPAESEETQWPEVVRVIENALLDRRAGFAEQEFFEPGLDEDERAEFAQVSALVDRIERKQFRPLAERFLDYLNGAAPSPEGVEMVPGSQRWLDHHSRRFAQKIRGGQTVDFSRYRDDLCNEMVRRLATEP